VSRLGDDKRYWKESAKMLATCIHLLRGTPYIFQGEELGMTNACYSSIDQYRDVESLNYYRIILQSGKTEEEALEILRQRSRDNGRTPMQWDGSANAGFTSGTPWITPPENYRTINVRTELQDPDSILYYYKKLIRLRKQEDVVSEGRIEFLCQDIPEVFAYRRYLGEKELFVVNNLTDRAVALGRMPWDGCEKILGNYGDSASILRPYEAAVLRRKRQPSIE